MVLTSLHVHSFRAHSDTRVQFAPKVNLLVGPNGAGKTNLLEAVHYLCLTKSFTATSDRYAVRKGARYFQLEGQFRGVQRSELDVRLAYMPGEGKRAFVNDAPLERLSELVGMLPVVVLSPGDHELTAGGPSERRRFLNNIMSQARPVYLDDLLKYRRTVRQRNELLKQARKSGRPPREEVIASWNAELLSLGSRIIHARHRFLKEFAGYLEEAYTRMEAVAEHPTITYDTIADLDEEADLEAIRAIYDETLERKARQEYKRGTTVVGPHRDELVFELDELEVRRYASQGQHRTFGMALKLAKYFYLKERLDEPPLFLLDDAFDPLDPERTRVVLELLQSEAIGQSLLTSTHAEPFSGLVPFDAPDHRLLQVENGEVTSPLPA